MIEQDRLLKNENNISMHSSFEHSKTSLPHLDKLSFTLKYLSFNS